MQNVNSFDIFDTLLTRKVKKPIDIFSIIEYKYLISNFASNRVRAEISSNGTLDDIYNHYARIENITEEEKERIKQIEILTELENIIPIQTNISRVQDSDIIVSDMYLDENTLKLFLKTVGLNKNTEVYVSKDGKHQGYIYQKLLEKYKINIHTGDNPHSDIHMANQYGIKTVHTSAHQFTKLENEIHLDLANIIREFRLKNSYREHTFEYELYNEQCKSNILILSVFCCQIRRIVEKENLDKILFVTRDCCLLQKLFYCFFPEINTVIYENSRLINQNHNEEYIEYVKNIYTDQSIIVDLNGAFKSGRDLYTKAIGKLPRVHLLCYNQSAPKYDQLSYSCEHTMDDYIELLNRDTVGTLIDYKDGVFVRNENENSIEYIKIIHNTIDEFVRFVKERNLLEHYISMCNSILDDPNLYRKLFSNYFFSNSYRGQIINE